MERFDSFLLPSFIEISISASQHSFNIQTRSWHPRHRGHLTDITDVNKLPKSVYKLISAIPMHRQQRQDWNTWDKDKVNRSNTIQPEHKHAAQSPSLNRTLSLGSKNIHQCSWQDKNKHYFFILKNYMEKTHRKGKDLDATVTELNVACFKVIGRRWGVFFCASAQVQWCCSVLGNLSPPSA